MTALDQFFELRNSAMLVQCLGEKVKIKSSNQQIENNGIFMSIDESMSRLLIQEDHVLCKKREIEIDDSFEYFKLEGINFCTKKINNGKLVILKSEIKIDAEISNSHKFANKQLVEFKVNDDETPIQFTLEDEKVSYDQFELNKERFNVTSTYCELKYTTPLNYGNLSEELKIKAQKIENELLQSNSVNRHVLEERGVTKCNDYEEENEEFKYSSVYREQK